MRNMERVIFGCLMLFGFVSGAWACTTGSWNGGTSGAPAAASPPTVARYSEFCAMSLSAQGHVQDNSCFRALETEATLLFTVPFDKHAYENEVRARITEDGGVEHVLEPIYHGDPIDENGCLCFYTFGWKMLDELRNLGFSTVAAHLYWSKELGYLGQEQLLFTAQK